MERLVTVAFSPHRVETLPFAEKLMSQHDIIILEEPSNKLFPNFLKEEISIEEYLKNTDFWFPTFIKESLKILRCLYKKGKKIFQVEPYLEKVAFIQKELESIIARYHRVIYYDSGKESPDDAIEKIKAQVNIESGDPYHGWHISIDYEDLVHTLTKSLSSFLFM